MMFIPQQVQIRVEPQQPQQQQQQQQQSDNTPNPIIQHIIQQIIAQKIMESQKASQENQPQETRPEALQPRVGVPERERPDRFPIPEEVLTQLNRLPNNDRVIVAVSEPESSEEDSGDDSDEAPEMRMQAPEQRQQPPTMELNNREAYMRRLPVNIPVNMMQQQVPEQEEPQAVASEEVRPHYVQPRSVSIGEQPKSRVARSANPLLPEKRVKRCACDCAC